MAESPPAGWPTRDGVPAVMVAFVNAYEHKLEEVTSQRVGAYKNLLRGTSCFSGGPTRKKLEKTKLLAAGLQLVAVFTATEDTQCAFLKRPSGVGSPDDAAASEDDKEYVMFECDCEEYFRSGGTICACTLAVAASKFVAGNSHINLDMLLESTAASRRGVGRPRSVNAGNCYGDRSSSSSSSSSAMPAHSSPHYYETQLNGKGAMFYHKWRVLNTFEEETFVGTIVSYRDDYHEEPRPYTSATPRTRLWKCRFEDCEEEDGQAVIEEYDAKQLSVYMSRAHCGGCCGPAPHDQPGNQLRAVPEEARVSNGTLT